MKPKIKRRWIKQEKQLVYLMYRKGLLEDFKINDLYWAEYFSYNRKYYKSDSYRRPLYMPEIHFCTTDYWGESDDHSIVDHVTNHLYWENIDSSNWDFESGKIPPSKLPKMTRGQFIKYLKKLPTKVGDKKINKIINKVNID